jgi:3-hydroxyacyl-CoA dehydrogenase
MQDINKVAVIGAGTMGSGIAGHLSNAGIPVLLFDRTSQDGNPPSHIAATAIERMQRSSPPALMAPGNAALIEPCNLDDDIPRLAEVDWIAEAIVERLDVKRDLFARIDAARRPRSMVSSNTSTLPLSLLVQGRSAAFCEDFCITHFFNPVRYMRLLELVAGPRTRPEVIDTLATFCDRALGKGVVHCRDTPGFLGNRVGVFALQAGIVEAHAAGLTVEQADAIMGRPMGIPKTGVFGLYDLIGLDLMLDVVESLKLPLPPSDPFYEVAPGIELVHALVQRGHSGNKSGAGFYRSLREGSTARREAVDLDSGAYRPARRVLPEAATAAERGGLRALVEYPDACGRFAWRVLARTLSYAASLVPEVADGPNPIDEAMKLGYSWSQGPFEMLDELDPAWFVRRLREDGLAVPAFLETVDDRSFYRAGTDAAVEQLDRGGQHVPIVRPQGVERLQDLKRSRQRITGNALASLWDVGEGVACVEFHSKANALSPTSMSVLQESLQRVREGFQALLIYNEAPHFSVGFNLEYALDTAQRGAWGELDVALADFQNTCRALRDAPFPVVAAPSGLGLGGGYEVLVHCDAMQAHSNISFGLVETLVGVVPSGGGCKEMLHRYCGSSSADEAQIGALGVFDLIGKARTASSPQEARELRLMRDVDRVSMNRDRLLGEGRALALSLVPGYESPPPPRFVALGEEGLAAMRGVLDDLVERGIALAHDRTVSLALARVLCGGDASRGSVLEEDTLLTLEREAFARLAHTEGTIARIQHMLRDGRPLRN